MYLRFAFGQGMQKGGLASFKQDQAKDQECCAKIPHLPIDKVF